MEIHWFKKEIKIIKSEVVILFNIFEIPCENSYLTSQKNNCFSSLYDNYLYSDI